MGFPAARPNLSLCPCRGRADVFTPTTRIIPDMNFTCSGTVVQWIAVADIRDPNAPHNAMLDIWRENSNEPGTYNRVGRIELGICGSEEILGMKIFSKCILPQNERVSVQPGDVVGVELPRRDEYRFRFFHLHNYSGAPVNYVFNGQFSTVTLSQANSTAQDQPLISLAVEPSITTMMTGAAPVKDISPTPITNPGPGPVKDVSGKGSNGLIIVLPVGGVVGVILLTAAVVLILVVVCLARKFKKRATVDRKEKNDVVQNVSSSHALDGIVMKDNLPYISVSYQVSTESNKAYGALEVVNLGHNNDCCIIDTPYNAQSQVQEGNCDYEYIK